MIFPFHFGQLANFFVSSKNHSYLRLPLLLDGGERQHRVVPAKSEGEENARSTLAVRAVLGI
jgi:hypothetical protein